MTPEYVCLETNFIAFDSLYCLNKIIVIFVFTSYTHIDSVMIGTVRFGEEWVTCRIRMRCNQRESINKS